MFLQRPKYLINGWHFGSRWADAIEITYACLKKRGTIADSYLKTTLAWNSEIGCFVT